MKSDMYDDGLIQSPFVSAKPHTLALPWYARAPKRSWTMIPNLATTIKNSCDCRQPLIMTLRWPFPIPASSSVSLRAATSSSSQSPLLSWSRWPLGGVQWCCCCKNEFTTNWPYYAGHNRIQCDQFFIRAIFCKNPGEVFVIFLSFCDLVHIQSVWQTAQ